MPLVLSTLLSGTYQGLQGNQGVQGLQGLQGRQGTQGLSNQGVQGTQGLQGTQGTQGVQGLQGLQGTQGTQGVQGLQGLQGLQGIFGPATIPQNSQSTAYVLVASDNGKHIDISTGGVTVPVNVFQVGENVVIYNDSAVNQTITQGANVTLRYSGTTQTGNRTLGPYGVCTVLCVADVTNADVFIISGAGLT
jgi:hypothetical protein